MHGTVRGRPEPVLEDVGEAGGCRRGCVDCTEVPTTDHAELDVRSLHLSELISKRSYIPSRLRQVSEVDDLCGATSTEDDLPRRFDTHLFLALRSATRSQRTTGLDLLAHAEVNMS